MTLPAVRVGERLGSFHGRLDADVIRSYAAATNDPSPRVRNGEAVPAAAIVTQIWAAQEAGRSALVSREVQGSASGGVHGEHDVQLHRPVVPGETLHTWVRGYAARPAGRNLLVTLHYSTYDDHDTLVAEQWWTTVYRDTAGGPVGPALPDHRFPDDARRHPVGVYTVPVDDDMPRRYAELSGDWSSHHFEVAAAQRSGFGRPFLHGLCTLALCTQGVVATVADGDPERVRRVAVRFATPVFVDETLTVRIFKAAPRSYAFEAECAQRLVITHGRAELRA